MIDSRVANEGKGWAGSGANPWHLDEETESIQFLTNQGDREVRIGYVVTAGGVNYYLTELKLKPHETRAIDIRKLRDAQEEDFRGNKIPAGATDGSVLWNRIEHVPVMGQLVVLQRHRGMASPYTCFMCTCGLSFQCITMTPATINLLVNETAQDTATAEYRNCNWAPFYFTVTTSTDFWSVYPNIATVNNSTQKGLVKGQSGGTTWFNAYFTDYRVDDSWYPDYSCNYYPGTCPSGNTTNVATISGPQTVWWFNGQTASGYATTITLTAQPSGATSYTWAFSQDKD